MKCRALAVFLALAGLGFQACKSASSAATPAPPPSVPVITVNPEDTPIYKDYAAQTFARDMVKVRSRADGYIESEYFDCQRRKEREPNRKIPLQLILADGEIHPHEGRIENTVNQVDPKTGTLEVQATFPNPQRTALPGQFGRVRMRVEDRRDAILVPQRAEELQGPSVHPHRGIG